MKKLLVVLLMLVAISASAQWVQMSNGMGTNKCVYSFASSGTSIFASSNGAVFLSTNDGVNWTSKLLSNTDFTSVLIKGSYIFAGTSGMGIFVSTNNGSSWSPSVNGLTNLNIHSLIANGNNVFAGTEPGGVFLSIDNGTSWVSVNNGLTNTNIRSFAVSGINLFAGTSTGGVFLSTNNGVSWAAAGLTNQCIYSLAVQGTNIFAGTDAHNVYLSTNNGNNWESVFYNYVYALAVSGQNLFAGTGTGNVFLTTNTGTNWIDKSQGLNITSRIQSLFVTNNYIFAGTYSNSVWRRPLSEIIGIQSISTETPAKYSLGQNYPNPFNPMCNVQFSMRNAGNVRLVVYDVQGREVQTLVNEKLSAGTYEVKFDGSAFTSGIYFYKLMTDGFTETKKMLLIK